MRRPAADARRATLGSRVRPLGARRALAQRRRRAGIIVGASGHVLRPGRDWPADAAVCGYWWPAPAGMPAPSLPDRTERFLADGPPPVFIGLGSTPVADPGAVTGRIVAAARRAQTRLILQRGWAGLGEGIDDPGVHLVDEIAYDALFPRVAAVVHHGGAGTTALGLRHGRPTLCLPAVADQFFWGHRIAAIGAGPAPLPLARLTTDRLARRLRALRHDLRPAARAADIAAGLAHEDGPAAAVAATERFLAG